MPGGAQGGCQLTVTEDGRVEPHWEVRQSQARSAKVSKDVPGPPCRYLASLVAVERQNDRHVMCPGKSDGPLSLGASQSSATRGDCSPTTAAVDAHDIDGAFTHDERLDLTRPLSQKPSRFPRTEELVTLAEGAVRRGVDVLGRPLVGVIDAPCGESADAAVQEPSYREHDAAPKPVVDASRLSSSYEPGVDAYPERHAVAVE